MTTDHLQSTTSGDILIVDDNLADLKFVSSMLTEVGYRVRPASDGEVALRSAMAKPPELILLDIDMPGMNGVEVCRHLKAEPATRDLPVIFISASEEANMKVTALKAGGIDYVTKPIDATEVLVRIDTHLNLHRLRQQLTARSQDLAAEIDIRKQTEDKLRQSEDYIRTIMDSLPIGIAVNSVDPTVTFSYMNSNFAKFYRTTAEALADSDAFWEAIYEDPEFREQIKQRVLEDCASGRPELMRWEDVPLTREGKATAYVTAQNTPLPDKGLMISTVWDVTERKQAEQALLQSSRLIALGQMAAGMAHELNQPLTVISALVDGAQIRADNGIEVTAEQRQAWDAQIITSVERMAGIIEHLRTFSRDNSHRPPESIALADVVHGALALTQTQLRTRGIVLAVELAEDSPHIMGDQARLEQVLINLLNNSRDALEQQRQKPMRLMIRTYHDDAAVILEVTDNGPGMDEETRLQVLEPFFTTKGPDRGTGLGLSISHAIVKDHGGEITCESTPGEGTVFKVRISTAAPQAQASPARP